MQEGVGGGARKSKEQGEDGPKGGAFSGLIGAVEQMKAMAGAAQLEAPVGEGSVGQEVQGFDDHGASVKLRSWGNSSRMSP